MIQVQRRIVAAEASTAATVERDALWTLNTQAGTPVITRRTPGVTVEWAAVPDARTSLVDGLPWAPGEPIPDGTTQLALAVTYCPHTGGASR